eukprot:m.595085 g.595085  ORF g.595085 m.595085 type:complete len:316 (+) comp58039_c0_seq8:259-1206(+)
MWADTAFIEDGRDSDEDVAGIDSRGFREHRSSREDEQPRGSWQLLESDLARRRRDSRDRRRTSSSSAPSDLTGPIYYASSQASSSFRGRSSRHSSHTLHPASSFRSSHDDVEEDEEELQAGLTGNPVAAAAARRMQLPSPHTRRSLAAFYSDPRSVVSLTSTAPPRALSSRSRVTLHPMPLRSSPIDDEDCAAPAAATASSAEAACQDPRSSASSTSADYQHDTAAAPPVKRLSASMSELLLRAQSSQRQMMRMFVFDEADTAGFLQSIPDSQHTPPDEQIAHCEGAPQARASRPRRPVHGLVRRTRRDATWTAV